MRLTRSSTLIGAIAAITLLAACGSDNKNSSSNTTASTAAAATTTSAAATTTSAAASSSSAAPASSNETGSSEASSGGGAASATGTVVALKTTPLGDILVDKDGRTLYLFQNDKAGQPSTCAGGCAAVWPALTTTGTPQAGDGIDQGDLGTVTNADGTVQVTFYGVPLYHYSQDTAPGDTHGQGVGGVWWVVDKEGKPVGAS